MTPPVHSSFRKACLASYVGSQRSAASAAWSDDDSQTPRSFQTDAQGWALNLYSASGDPIRTIELPAASPNRRFAYDGRSIAYWQSGDVWILDASGRAIRRFKPQPDGIEARDWPLLLAAGGRELWMFDGAKKTIHRFAIP